MTVVLDEEFKKKFRVAVAIYTIFMLLLLAGAVFMVTRILKNRKQIAIDNKTRAELCETVKKKQSYLKELQAAVDLDEQ